MGSTWVTPSIIEYITRRPGKVVTRSELEKNLELTAKQITGALSAERLKKTAPIFAESLEVVAKGGAWKYKSPAQDRPTDKDSSSPAPAKRGRPRKQPLINVSEFPGISPTSPQNDTQPGKMLEIMGNTKDGALLARSTSGKIYRAELI